MIVHIWKHQVHLTMIASNSHPGLTWSLVVTVILGSQITQITRDRLLSCMIDSCRACSQFYLFYVFAYMPLNEGRAKGGNADGKGNFGLMNYSYNVVDVNPQSVNQEILIMRKSEIYDISFTIFLIFC